VPTGGQLRVKEAHGMSDTEKYRISRGWLAAAALLLLVPTAARAGEPPGAAKLKELGIVLVQIPAGEFPMGSTDGEEEEQPVHAVKLSSFWLATTEVTQAQWKAVTGKEPAAFKGCADCPVESVSWVDVQEFLKTLNAAAGATFRLPTEAEWEYAAGGGAADRTRWAGTSSLENLGEYAWYADTSERKTHPVGTKKPNALGLYDMSGNVWEWCADWHDDKYYGKSPAENPLGPQRGFGRILRGGSWINSEAGVRVSIRHRVDPDFRNINLNGLRIAADAP
jgi:formylglycine-generating enzyme required for sulfatase activity